MLEIITGVKFTDITFLLYTFIIVEVNNKLKCFFPFDWTFGTQMRNKKPFHNMFLNVFQDFLQEFFVSNYQHDQKVGVQKNFQLLPL